MDQAKLQRKPNSFVMEATPKSSTSTDPASEKFKFLSVNSDDSGIDRRRGSSSSIRTTLGDAPDAERKREFLQRAQTQVAEVHLSWWQALTALLRGPKSLKRALAKSAHVKIAHPENVGRKMFDHSKCDFFISITAFPNPQSNITERQSAQCILDTGCLQGNLISAAFAQRLGFTDYRDLHEREENGATVVTGHVHKAVGAVHVSWYHNTSPQVYNDMRFLVSESAQFDLVIGTHSLQRWGILSPPNLFVDMDTESNPKREKLAGQLAKLETDVETAKRKLKASKKGDAEHDLKAKRLDKKKKEREEAKKKLELFDLKAKAKRPNADPAMLAQIAELEKELHKHEDKKDRKKDQKKLE